MDRTQRFRAPALPTKGEEAERREFASDYASRSEGASGHDVAAEGYSVVERRGSSGYGPYGGDTPRGADPVRRGGDAPWDETDIGRVVY